MSTKSDPVKILTAFFVNAAVPELQDSGYQLAFKELAEQLGVEFGADGDTIEMALRETFKAR